MMQIKISASNGFPLGASMKMSLYDSATNSTKSTVSATDVLEPAAVDSNGKATTPTKTSTSIDFTKDFFSFVNKTDKIIFSVTFQSTGNGSQDVKIYSDYRIYTDVNTGIFHCRCISTEQPGNVLYESATESFY